MTHADVEEFLARTFEDFQEFKNLDEMSDSIIKTCSLKKQRFQERQMRLDDLELAHKRMEALKKNAIDTLNTKKKKKAGHSKPRIKIDLQKMKRDDK